MMFQSFIFLKHLCFFKVSDDEDETHQNIDTRSLFKWRHEARIQRMEDMETKKEQLQKRLDE